LAIKMSSDENQIAGPFSEGAFRVAQVVRTLRAFAGSTMWRLAATALVACAALASPAAVAAPQAADSGRRENFPPSPRVEWVRMRVDLDFPDLAARTAQARALLVVRPSGLPTDVLRLDADGLEILSVGRVKGRAPEAGADAALPSGEALEPLEHSHDGTVLQVRFPEPLAESGVAGESPAETAIVVEYVIRDPLKGMTFSPPVPGVDGGPPQGAELHTQGQPESNRGWFPIHDFPNIRLATELRVDVPRGVSVSGNGKLVRHEVMEDRERWQWLQSRPHVPYLVSLVAGEFARTPLPAPLSGVPMQVWTAPSKAHLAEGTYANTDRMMVLFARIFGEDYPWDRYDQLVVRNFRSGGMENTSVTTMHPGAILDEVAMSESDLDGLIAHELCHQWTGDLVTCRSWEHLWLNEGWATYGSVLWARERDGNEAYWDGMLDQARVANGDGPDNDTPMCSRMYAQPGETFSRRANPYPKGASILHMLKMMLGEELFTRGVHLYMDRHKDGLVETVDFRRALEEVSGLSLERFFDQWCFTPGTPRVKVTPTWDAESRTLKVEVAQTQPVTDAQPAWHFDLPVAIEADGAVQVVKVPVDSPSAVGIFPLAAPPTMVAVDPELTVLKVLEVDMPTAWLVAQAKRGPTSASRRQAMRVLASRDEAASREALAAILMDARVRYTQRMEAASALGGMGSPEAKELVKVAALAAFAADGVPREADPRVRRAIIEAWAASQPCAEAMPWLLAVARMDPGYATRGAALSGLTKIASRDDACRKAVAEDAAVAEIVAALLASPSPGERLRLAALDAAADLKLVAMRDSVAELVQLGNFDRMRPRAISAWAKLAPAEDEAQAREAMVTALIAMLDDPERQSADAAGQALAQLRAKPALERIDAIAASDRDPQRRERAQRWAKAIRG
jgi:aminopeptidase N